MQYNQAFASEIDPYAMGVAHYNHPMVKQMGSVLDIHKHPMYVPVSYTHLTLPTTPYV